MSRDILEIFAEAQGMGVRYRDPRFHVGDGMHVIARTGRAESVFGSPEDRRVARARLRNLRYWADKELREKLSIVTCRIEVVKREAGYRWERREGCSQLFRVRDDEASVDLDEAAE